MEADLPVHGRTGQRICDGAWGAAVKYFSKMQDNKISVRFAVKIFLMILVLVVFPFVLVNLHCQYRLEHFIQQKMSSNVIQNVERNQSYINDSLQDLAYYSNVFAYDEGLRERIASRDTSEYDNTRYFDRMIDQDDVVNNSEIRNQAKVILFDRWGRVYSNWSLNYRDYQFILDEDWVKESITSDGHLAWGLFTPSYIEEEKGKRYISLARSVLKDRTSGERIGTLVISINQDVLSRLMMQYAYEGDQAYICINQGEILLASKEHRISEEELAQIGEEIADQDNGWMKRKIDGTEYLVSYSVFPHPWLFNGQEMRLIHFTDYQPIRSEVNQVRMSINLVVYLAIALVVALSWISSRKLVEPIEILTDKMEHYSLEGEITGLDLNRKDEIGRLNQGFVQMSGRIHQLFRQLEEESEVKERYHYESLRAQLNPHFLFNTLNTIRWMAIIRNADNIVESIDSVASILKYSMSQEKGMVTIRQEIDNIRNYISIHNLRYAAYVQLKLDVKEEYLEYQTLKFILQPIVENSILHGFDKTKSGITVQISAERKDDRLYLIVEDDGVGISENFIEHFEEEKEKRIKGSRLTGIGLTNVDAYIRIRFGEEYGLRLDKDKIGGARVIFTLPVILGGEGQNND